MNIFKNWRKKKPTIKEIENMGVDNIELKPSGEVVDKNEIQEEEKEMKINEDTLKSSVKNYVGAKIIKAEPMTEGDFIRKFKDGVTTVTTDERGGYLVIYPDGYKSWSPRETFENAYRLITDGEIKLIKEG